MDQFVGSQSGLTEGSGLEATTSSALRTYSTSALRLRRGATNGFPGPTENPNLPLKEVRPPKEAVRPVFLRRRMQSIAVAGISASWESALCEALGPI